MTFVRTFTGICAAVIAAAGLAHWSAPAVADFDAPKKIDCKKKENKTKPACKPSRGNASNDEIYQAAYWLAQSGKFAEARELARKAKDQNDPRILNTIGFATRKLGDVDAAMPFYIKALSHNPDYTVARAYLGEAYLIKGDVVSAKVQLGEIAKRCGTSCSEHANLADHIAKFEAAAVKG